MDVDSDGLPDVLVTDPAAFAGSHGVFFQGRDGVADKMTSDVMAVLGLNGENATTLRLSNPNVSLQDLDGDGFVDLLHMPKASTYTIYGPKLVAGAWQWAGRKTTTADGLSPALDLQKNQGELRVLDANGDGLVDVVITQGTAIETHLALGRFPGGDGLFGSAHWTGPDTAVLSSEPIRRCVPWAGAPVRFSDSDVRLGDVNGDGLPDIVRIRPGEIKYWPGRGDGVWGTGDPADCKDGTFGQNTSLDMDNGPWSFDTPGLRLDDVNGDGLDDLVDVRFQEVDVWLNIDGHGFTDRHILKNTPVASSLTNRVRLLDVNGSGTRDLVWGDGNEYKYIDLSAGNRPWLLTKVANGLGKTTEITYRSSVDLMLDARAAGKPWATTTPMPLEVVTAVTEKDNLPVAGRPGNVHVTTYTYRDPLFEGRQREFRGFKDVSVRREGDANSPAATTRSVFLLGECLPVDAPDCQPAARWKDNPRESLKGLPVFSEISDDAGVFLETNHHTYLYRVLYKGLDGRRVVHASERQSDQWRYDTGPFKPQTKTLTLTEVEGEAPGAFKLRAVAGTTHERNRTEVDLFGNRTKTVDEGCVEGCPSVDEIISTTFVPDRVGGDQTGWLWRTVETWIEGDQHPGVQRKRTLTTYDPSGNPLTTVAMLAGTLPLQRSHAAGGAVAPPPASASQDGAILLVSQVHDAYGNVVSERGAGNRCRRMDYDSVFADLAVTERVYVGALDNSAEPCGQQELAASAQIDRGYGAARRLTDLHGEVSQVDFDGLGRPVAAWKPSATTVGALSSRPSALYEYDLPADPVARPYAVVRTRTQNGLTDADNSYQEAWAIVDGFGRALVTLQQADPDVDGHAWVVNGHTEYDAKGAARRVFLAWFWDGDPGQFPLGVAPATQATRTRYDAFGRTVQTFGLDNSQASKNVYHALSEDMWDAGDLSPGPYQGTFASTRSDGHGRTVENTERVHGANGKLELRTVETKYLPSGPIEKITRRRVGKPDAPVVRWMQHDTLDRMVLNVEQSTATNFVSDPTLATDALRAWRYAFDDAGELVGTSDARGCGVNTAYDAGGRLICEDYSPCEALHAVYDAASDVVYHYDTPDADAPTPAVFAVDASLLQGRLVSVRDRASHVLTRYDGRGRVTGLAKRLASPNSGPVAYVGPWQSQTVTFDGADRPVRESTGARAAAHVDNLGESWVETRYTKRGSVREVVSSYGLLASRVEHDADGLVTRVVHGDFAHTETAYGYDEKRRLRSVQTYRGPPGIWTAPPPGYSPQYGTSDAQSFPLLLEDLEYRYDAADNPVEIHDYRLPEEWRAGAKPVSRRMQYDDNYRLTNVEYQYANGDDTWKSPWAYENQAQEGHFPKANPQPTLSYTKRPQWQRYAYDWLGNRASSDDDARGFYDRSLGTESHTGPYQLTGAGNRATAVAQPREGVLAAKYDAAGNLTALTVVRNGAGVCERGATCSAKFAYRYDELGRLATARRWDLAADSFEQTGFNPALDEPTTTPAVELTYSYDATDQRVRKSVTRGGATEHTLYIFAALELRKVDDATVQSTGVYTQDVSTERVYLLAHGVRLARIAVETGGALPSTGSGVHVLLEMSDHLGSAAMVVDRDTSELVEHRTYQPFGGVESDERADRWEGFRESYGFTGKEEDEEVGLSYFGKRYLSSALGRWTTADPLAVHSPGSADLNLYAYVSGRVFVSVDPRGLEKKEGILEALSPSGSFGQWLVHANHAEYLGAPGVAVNTFIESEKAQSYALQGTVVVAAGAATFATGGLAAPLLGGGGLGAMGAGALGGAVGGGTAAVMSSAYDVDHAGRNPGTVAQQVKAGVVGAGQGALEGAAFGGGGHLAGKAFVAVKQVVSRPAPKPSAAPAPKPSTVAAKPAAAPRAATCNGGACAGPCSFPEGTIVWTPTGPMPIEQVNVGDLLLSQDAFGVTASYATVATIGHEVESVRVLWIQGLGERAEVVVTTDEHPFYVDGEGWVPAGELWVGAAVWQEGARVAWVTASERIVGRRWVYNFDVADAHSYLVGWERVWVHNQCPLTGEAAANDNVGRTFQTYTKPSLSGGKPYSGRTSGFGTAAQNVAARDARHHTKGFGEAVVDRSSTSKDAIRGREQMLIDANGGAQRQGGTSGNEINGIRTDNPKRQGYIDAAKREFK